MTIEHVGCCGAYCARCGALADGTCRGCRLGYDTGERSLKRARCAVKVCCLTKDMVSCADCAGFESCETLAAFYGRKGYVRYRKALEFVREHGYEEFVTMADGWPRQYGRWD